MDSKKKKKKKILYRSNPVVFKGGPEMAHRHVDDLHVPPGVLAQLSEDSLLAMKARRSGMKPAPIDVSRAWQNEMDNDLIDL